MGEGEWEFVTVASNKKIFSATAVCQQNRNQYSTFLFLILMTWVWNDKHKYNMAIWKHFMWSCQSCVFVFCAYCCFSPPPNVDLLCSLRLLSEPWLKQTDICFVIMCNVALMQVLLILNTLCLSYCDIYVIFSVHKTPPTAKIPEGNPV